MKILGVNFKNINSLTGAWEIRFDRSPISDTGLFAIVGPNGSGKSSILDAITLGLYGETARLGSPETGIQNLSEKESYAEVTFSVMDHRYCSRWSVQKTGDNPEPPEMSLFALNGGKTLLESRTIPVRNRIAELTGLDFKRFCRSILLAQGEFSAFLDALENERADILEKIIGPEMLQDLEKSIRTRADIESERLHQLKEEAAGFQTPGRAHMDEIRLSMEQAREDSREIDRTLETLRDLEAWLERMEQEPMAEQDAVEALRMAETRFTEARQSLQQLELARPAERYKKALARGETLKARAEEIQREGLRLEAQVPAREERIGELEKRLSGIRTELDAARERLAARNGVFIEAATLDREIVATGERFLKTVSRLEAISREQRDTSLKQSELEERTKDLDGRIQDLLQWIEAHAGEKNLEAEIPAMESLLTRFTAIRQQMEKYENTRSDAFKADRRAARALGHAETAVQKAQSKADLLKDRKTDRDARLQAVFGGETQDSLKAGIDHGIKKLAVCKALIRIGRKADAFGNVRDELPENNSRMEALTESISMEQSRLQALEGQIRQRDTIRRFDPDRGLLQPEEPCPLCGASIHPFLDNGGIDFTELDHIVREREDKIRTLRIELESLQTQDMALRSRIKALEELQQEWAGQCAVAGEAWDFGDINSPSESIRIVRKEIRSARSRMRTAWWHLWRAKWTDRGLERKLEKLSKREKLLELARDEHETRQKSLAQINGDMDRLGENADSVRSELSGHLQRWQEPLPDPGSENLPVERLRERSEMYSLKRRERTAAADELRLLQIQRQTFSGVLQRLQEEAQPLSTESEAIQTRLNTLKADRKARYGILDPTRERQTLESEVAAINAEEQSLTREVDALRQGMAADRKAFQQLADQALQTRKEADDAERDLLEQSSAAGFLSLNDIRDGLAILQGEQEVMSRLAGAERALTASREALEALRPKHTTQDSLDTVRWKISDAIRRQKTLEQDIDGCERALEQQQQAQQEYRELLQAIAVQEKAYAEAMEVRQSVEGQGEAGGKLQQLLLKQLMEETNRHLTALSSGRYSLRPSRENVLGLYIEDALQARALRSVKTLSGGETFLVSLCLALGLSDMAGQHRNIESLFLDEGFGALDDEMLYKVMSALKSLRASGKTVGIVSHVKRLAEEIPTQIRLEKGQDGSTRITIVA
ncbi:MAG: AAA family ATPase [Deltaproteobacteria bacterium]|nr:AAA family ATPase [Deltaproteobacteria bacterium]